MSHLCEELISCWRGKLGLWTKLKGGHDEETDMRPRPPGRTGSSGFKSRAPKLGYPTMIVCMVMYALLRWEMSSSLGDFVVSVFVVGVENPRVLNWYVE